MAPQTEAFTIGVEEEYQIIDPKTRELRGQATRILLDTQETLGEEVQPEIYLSQIETATPVCQSLAEVRSEVARLRQAVTAAAAKDSSQIAAAGTHPFSDWKAQQVTPKKRYQGLAQDYQQLLRELVIFGSHVHVGLRDRELAVQVMNRSREWLAPLLALSTNSPFWLGMDTGYASYRTELWGRFPVSGPPLMFASYAEYQALAHTLVATGTVRDATKLYWDVRLSERFETLEFRVTDVCMTLDEAVMIAGLTRALVRTCYQQALEDEPFVAARPELLRAAHWRAARYGLAGDLINLRSERAVPARELVEALLTFVRSSLEDLGDWDEVSAIVQEIFQRGTGAARQRQAYQRQGRWEDVVDLIVGETARGVATGA